MNLRARHLGLALVLSLSGPLSGCGPSEEEALAERGGSLSSTLGCNSCHSTDGSPSVGPTWKGLYGSQVELEDGSFVTADEEYLAESIRDPSAKTVRGYPEGLMETAIKPSSVRDEEIRALLAYMKTLR